jgi:sugar transferase EpsL
LKRALDVILAGAAMIVLSPIMILTAIVIRIGLGSPVLFKQQRPGLHGRPFHLYKFRTMTEKRDANGNLLDDAERLTALGRWVRRLSLDELPQCINVMKGDLSVVGPRPLLMEYLPLYSAEQARRHDVKPGITGWAQINGRNALSWQERLKLDVWYVDHHSLMLDLKILVVTVGKVFKGEGISQEGRATVERFKGT